MEAICSDSVERFDDSKVKELMDEKVELQQQFEQIANSKQKHQNAKSRLDEMFEVLDMLADHPMEFDNQMVRQVLECVVVESKEKKVVFKGGLEVEQEISTE